MANLINNLGGTFGFGENYLSRNDDSYSSYIDLSSIFENGINFFGETYTGLYVNNNGNVTFGYGLSNYTPTVIGGNFSNPIIAPFWADVDTRSTNWYDSDISDGYVTPSEGGTSQGTNLTWYDIDEVNKTFTVTWDDVGYFSRNTEKVNAFQLQLISTGNGNFDIVYRYEDINWTTGDASYGSNGLGGTVARAGFSAGDGLNYHEFYFSGDQNFMLNLDENQLTSSSESGVWKYSVNEGSVIGMGLENNDDTIIGTPSNDIMDGRSGNDILSGGLGDDTISGGEGDDILYGNEGNDSLIGGNGSNQLFGGDGIDSALYLGIRNTLDISSNDNGTFTVTSEDIEDILDSIELISFDDGDMSVDYAVEVRENQEEFARFYNALFQRLPDNEGLSYWVNDLIDTSLGGGGNTIQGAAQAFADSHEFQELYGNDVNNSEFINLLYQNILNRQADTGGYNYWLNEIGSTNDRGGMIVNFANSEEFINNTENEINQYLQEVPLDDYILI
ncbi:hypothetical protein CP965_11015 [Halarcobacter mediterraneus]|uniref:NIDO domain-containing protein n=1 Tax=Halarcobacter mediterraneus TaxID=2023153 RepID=A0A4Q1AT41_9BACT|nr:nidogen-like domain-containing protein [Halarcobacter mediterraneus]RXK12288.1 hypothetical protein CP965_11015 [Halarcobacter mediterraneus]